MPFPSCLIPTQPDDASTCELGSVQFGGDSSICWYILRGDACPYREACKYVHLPNDELDKLIKSKVVEGATVSNNEASSIQAEIAWKLSMALRKTRICFKYEKGACDKDAQDCIFLHVKGQDAKKMITLSRQQKDCPYELYLQNCIQSGCLFKHLKERSRYFHKPRTTPMGGPKERLRPKRLENKPRGAGNARGSFGQSQRVDLIGDLKGTVFDALLKPEEGAAVVIL
ncbi:hypothetical protein P389DRAFT_195151 [Cystobasidium minutum MCA 4210]|uniref:uncharacterized protein n=1 Tax=Cystobasidium minutum MCA 4210 TaxID=1397322 RepID=UPI0034D01C82|eukprot:jgi/Rhomi1/195151/gm1.3365_g